MKIKVKDLASKVNKLRDMFSGEIMDFEYDDQQNQYRVESEYYLHAVLGPEDELDWRENGLVDIGGNTFYTCYLQDVKPE